VAHGLVLGGIGLHLGAVQGHMAKAHHPRFLAQPQDLNKQTLEGIEIAPTEVTDPAVIRLLVTGQYPEGQILVTGPLDLAVGDDAHAVGVEQEHRQPLRGRLRLHPGVKPLLAAGILGLSGNQDLGEIQLDHQIEEEIDLVVLGEPLAR